MSWFEGIALTTLLLGLAGVIFLCNAWATEREKRRDMKRHINDK